MKKPLILYRSFMGLSAAAAAAAFAFLLSVPAMTGDGRIILRFLKLLTSLWCVFSLFECFAPKPLIPRLGKNVRASLSCAAASALILSATLETMILSDASEHRLSDRADAILVLGAGLRGGRPSPTLRRRLAEAARLAELAPDLPVIVSGGQGPDEDCPETEVMKDFLVQHGVAPERIVPESRARTTRQNFQFSRHLFRWKNPGKPCAYVVTNSFHMFRACLTGRDDGWDCIPWSSSDEPWIWPILHLREQLAILKHLVHPARFSCGR